MAAKQTVRRLYTTQAVTERRIQDILADERFTFTGRGQLADYLVMQFYKKNFNSEAADNEITKN